LKNKIAFLLTFLLFGQISFSQNIDHWEKTIDPSDTWNYIVPTSELPTTWTNPEFDCSSWLSGPGGFGYGDNDDNTILASGTLSVFIRKDFNVSDVSSLISAILYVDYDDAFVAYLNGTEIARANIGTINIRPAFNTIPEKAVEPASVSGAIPPRFVIDASKLASALRPGINTLALQIHNYQASSSDLSSTTYFIAGFTSISDNYRIPPSWFFAPPSYSSHLPLVVIDTWGGYISDEPKIDAWIKVIDNGSGKINNTNNPGTDFEGYIGIETRGQSSTQFPKIGYGFETRNQLKADSTVSLLGMPKESDWILSAPYSDKSVMRNPLTFYLGNRMGRWQPHTKWCELYLNNDYRGVYLLVEKIKRDKNRVHIDKLLPTELAGDSLTGGYILKVDKVQDLSSTEYFRTNPISWGNARHYDFTYVYPKADEIMPAQKTYIANFLTNFENALNGTNFKDPVKGFRPFIDQTSFAEFEIIQELTNNVDGYRYSTFFYKEKDSDGGKLIAGPLWDFDLCYGNVDYSARNLATNQWLYTNYGPNEGYPMHWWARLMQDPEYSNLVKLRYSTLRLGPLNTDSIFTYLDNNQALLGEAITRNFERWPILDTYVWPNYYIGGTYDNEMDYLKTWVSARLEWLDSKWLIPLSTQDFFSGKKDFLVYPNPFSNKININICPHNLDNMTVDIFNLSGQKVISRILFPENTSPSEFLIENIIVPSGMYIIQVRQSGLLIGYEKLICTDKN
jgi:hypothetical protein